MIWQVDRVVARLAGGAKCRNSVVDLAAWAALRTKVPLVIHQQTEASPRFVPMGDFNGAIWLGPTGAMLNDAALEERRRHVQGRAADEQHLRMARQRAEAFLSAPVAGCLTPEDAAAQAGAALVVRSLPQRRLVRGRPNLEPALVHEIRRTPCAMLLARNGSFAPPEQVVIAFDGSASACERIGRLKGQALLSGLPVLLALAGTVSPMAIERLHQARQILQSEGFSVDIAWLQGPPALAIPELLSSRRPSLLVIGAFAGSRLRRWLSGSTTAALLLSSPVPVMIQR